MFFIVLYLHMKYPKILFLLGITILLPITVSSAEIGFVTQNIWVSDETPLVGDAIDLYAVIVNSGSKHLEGIVVFRDTKTGLLVGSQKPIFLGSGNSQVVSTQWGAVAGEHQFKAEITQAVEVDVLGNKIPVANNLLSDVTSAVFVDVDSDNDGIGDQEEQSQGTDPHDADTDNDGLTDGSDPFPTNSDGDGDGDPDGSDPDPLDGNVFTPPDHDGDGVADRDDSDLDNDGLYNFEEIRLGTDPNNPDTDGDGVNDKQDAYPTDPLRYDGFDMDGDGIPDSEDADIDGDGLYNFEEEKLGTDLYNSDTDGDGVGDKEDAYPLDASKSSKDDSKDQTNTSSVLGTRINNGEPWVYRITGGENGVLGRFLSLDTWVKVAIVTGGNAVLALMIMGVFAASRRRREQAEEEAEQA